MKILLIITPFYPSQTPNTLRWIPIIEYFESKEIETTVLTTKNRGSNHNLTLSSEVHEAGYNTLLDWLYFTLKVKRRRNLPSSDSEFSEPSFFSKLTQWFIDKTWRKTYWPDGSQLFYRPGLKKAKQIISDKKITHVISVGLPFTCHLIASTLKEVYPYLHWHQDIEDPFSYSEEFWVNNFDRYRQKNIEAERKAFELSDSISVTNPRAKSKYELLFPKYAHKLCVIYPMFAKTKSTSKIDLDLASDKIHIAYFGSFYERVRSPEPLLSLLERIQKINAEEFHKFHFHFFGQQNRFSLPIFKFFESLQGQITLHGLKDRDYCIAAMSEVDFLINIGNITDYHLPSKVVDFLYCNKPLINVISSKDDATIPLLAGKIETCKLFINEKDGVFLAEKLWSFINRKRIATLPSVDNISNYNTEIIAEKYLETMQTV